MCYEAATDRMCSITDSGAEYSQTNGVQPCSRRRAVVGSRARHVKLSFGFSTESQQAACLKPIKSATSVSLLILKSDVKTYKWQRFMSEVHRLLFVLAVQRLLYSVYFNSDAALRLDTVRKHETHAGYAGTGCLHQATFWWPSCLSIQHTMIILLAKTVWLCYTDMLTAHAAFEQCGHWLALRRQYNICLKAFWHYTCVSMLTVALKTKYSWGWCCEFKGLWV